MTSLVFPLPSGPDGTERALEVFVQDAPAALRVLLPGGPDDHGLRVVFTEGDVRLTADIDQESGELPLPARRYGPGARIHVEELRRGQWRRIGAPAMPPWVPDVDVVTVRPMEWGIDEDCLAVVQEPSGNAFLHIQVPALGSVDIVLSRRGDPFYSLRFFAWQDGRRGEKISNPSRLVDRALSPAVGPARADLPEGRLGHVVRQRVTLTPMRSSRLMPGSFGYAGYVGAWSGEEPIPEVLEFTLGRQQHLFDRFPVAVAQRLPAPIIYLGSPHGSWGHYLTQGLSRAWYALQHPEIPVLWGGGNPPAFHQQVRALLGMRNEEFVMNAAAYSDEVIFPDPGIGLGDYVDRDHARRMGVFPPERPTPGRKLFVARAPGSGRGNLVDGGDRRLADLMADHGFELFSPERHDVATQLAELTSAEVVAGVEGSVFHSMLLVDEGCATRFRAFSRHRGGSGVYEHLRVAKGLDYRTLNFRIGRAGSARSQMDMDLQHLSRVLVATSGFSDEPSRYPGIEESPFSHQPTYGALRATAQTGLTPAQVLSRDLPPMIDARWSGEASELLRTLFRY